MGKYLLYLELFLSILLFYFGSLGRVVENGLLPVPFTTGVILALWAFYNMGTDVFSPFPQPRKNHKIVQKGVYKYIRHPMYTGLLLIALSLFLSHPNFLSFLIFALFAYVLDEKATLEETLLTKLHSEYQAYKSATKKFIPYLY